MKKIVIGHRGTGKSSFLIRHREIFPEVPHWDLDTVIQTEVGQSVGQIFSEQGEEAFRKLEISLFKKIVNLNNHYVIAVGGGFSASLIRSLAPDAKIIYVRRDTDAGGRIFLDRPRLNEELSPLDESLKRYSEREKAFRSVAQEIYHLPEGFDQWCSDQIPKQTEQIILKKNFSIGDAYYTLSKKEAEEVKDNDMPQTYFSEYRNLELRTDLLTEAEILNVLHLRPRSLVSVRTDIEFNFPESASIDEDLNFFTGRCQIVSSHSNNVKEGVLQLSNSLFKDKKLKLCPLVRNFDELMLGHRWQREEPERRSFLPRSTDGRWLWYRMLARYQQPINFVRGLEFTLDQPSPFQWLSMPSRMTGPWGAVLGEPVAFSRSPLFHMSFFYQRQSYFTRVEIDREDFIKYFDFLVDCGLGYAAVTAPLKELAFKMAPSTSSFLKTANTLFIKNKSISSENTDLTGFQFLISMINAGSTVAVWGGGGTLSMMQSVLPQAHYFSSRTGQLRDSQKMPLSSYDYLIWAAPRKESMSWPDPNQIKFSHLIDLNYNETSAGLEFAAANKISYTSGLEMFQKQAIAQQDFWSLCERQ